jgi:hypothetical protein
MSGDLDRAWPMHPVRPHNDKRPIVWVGAHDCWPLCAGVLTFQDTTHGKIVAQHRPRLGALAVLRQNPWNAVSILGHANGRVTMWTPNITAPVVSLQAHLGPVRCLAVESSGKYLATAGVDRQVHIWDLRKAYKCLHSYYSHAPAAALDISQRGLLAVGYGSQVRPAAVQLSMRRHLLASLYCYVSSNHRHTASLWMRSHSPPTLHQDMFAQVAVPVHRAGPPRCAGTWRQPCTRVHVA